MTLQEQERVTKALTMLAVIIGEDVSDERIEAYLVVLGDLDGTAVERAIERLGRAAKFFPKPVEIRELIEDSVSEKAERAWVLLVEACHQSGDRSVFIEDVCLAQAMLDTFGTWIQAYEIVVRLTPEMVASKRKEFVSNYRRAEKRPPDQDNRLHPGRQQVNNRENLAHWSQKWIERGQLTYPANVLTIRDKVSSSSVACSVENGNLTGDSWRQLTSGTEPKQLPAKPVVELPEPSPEARAMTPAEIQEGIKALTRSTEI